MFPTSVFISALSNRSGSEFSAGITPYANLYHYDLPLALEIKYKGLLSDQVV
jgi:hypothetical protein